MVQCFLRAATIWQKDETTEQVSSSATASILKSSKQAAHAEQMPKRCQSEHEDVNWFSVPNTWTKTKCQYCQRRQHWTLRHARDCHEQYGACTWAKHKRAHPEIHFTQRTWRMYDAFWLHELTRTTDRERCEVCFGTLKLRWETIRQGSFSTSQRRTSVRTSDTRMLRGSRQTELLHAGSPPVRTTHKELHHILRTGSKKGNLSLWKSQSQRKKTGRLLHTRQLSGSESLSEI